MVWADMFMSYMYCFVVRNIPYILITGDRICRRYGLVASCGVVAATTFFRYSKFTHVRETKVLSFWRSSSLVSLDDVSRQPPVCPVAGVTSGWRHFRFSYFLWNRIYNLSSTPFYERTAIKLYSLTLCVLYPKHYSYQHPSYLGVLDMCLILSLYLHVLSLSVGFRSHYLWYCLYVYLLIICMYYFICGFYVSLSFDIVYMYIYLCIYSLKVGG